MPVWPFDFPVCHAVILEISIKASRRYYGSNQKMNISNDEVSYEALILYIYQNY